MQRTGDLLQRESLLTTQSSRHKTAEMAILLGQAMEHISKATGSVAHIYKNFEMGPNPGLYRIQPGSYDETFSEIVRSTGSVQ